MQASLKSVRVCRVASATHFIRGSAPLLSARRASSSQTSSGSDGKAKPAIYHPPSAAEKDDPEVKKHNDDMRQRHEQSINQLSETGKVQKGTGDKGESKKK